MLYPKDSRTRRVVDISGFWNFSIDFENSGRSKNYQNGLPLDSTTIPVPSSFADLFTDKDIHEFTGNVWYQTSFYLPEEWKDKVVNVRFGCATHNATVYLNGHEIASHIGGFVPFNAPANEFGKFGDENLLVVVVNNELSDTTIPAGDTQVLPNGKKMSKPSFDFFNYSGLNRPVKLTAIPNEHVEDISVVTDINGNDGVISYEITTTGNSPVIVEIYESQNPSANIQETLQGKIVASANGTKGNITVPNAKLWNPGNAYLYKLKVIIGTPQAPIDEYITEIGIRTIKVEGTKFLINGKPFYFKGFGKHEENEINGRGYNPVVIKRDFELLKWVNANSFRTSHYPYSEEILQMADREGFVIIDECAAVGFNVIDIMASAFGGKIVPFFERESIEQLKVIHKEAIRELVQRDKNHPCVCMWSLMNEPDSTSEKSLPYFKDIFDYSRTLDPQHRPLTYASIQSQKPDKCMPLVDVICLNRYYGWYFLGGYELDSGIGMLSKELQMLKALNKPIIFTEFGCDTMPGIHKLPSAMWSEEYQREYLEKTFATFDSFDYVIGEQIWNFADFQTSDGIIRVDGNKKGIFTRQRQPKQAAFYLKERWGKLESK